MRPIPLDLSGRDRQPLEEVRSRGARHAREVNRARILATLARDTPQAAIVDVTGLRSGVPAAAADGMVPMSSSASVWGGAMMPLLLGTPW